MIKKFAFGFIFAFMAFNLIGCEQEEPASDSDIVYEIINSISFDNQTVTADISIPEIAEDVTVTWQSSNEAYLTSEGVVTIPTYIEGNQSVTLMLAVTLNDVVMTRTFDFTVIAEERPEQIELYPTETDNLALTFSYENTDFLPDGVGEVSLVRCVDGDTAIFTENGESFSVRFLGIDTPESTAKFEPWGKAASDFTCDKLTNAETIVLQADPSSDRLDSYGTRYLSWVWYDGRLLNLELVELAYSKAKGDTNSLYGGLIFDINLDVQKTELKVWGETDPNYDYSLEGVQLTIEELVTNPADYYGTKVAISGIVTRTIGGAAFIQNGEYGIYVYNRSWAPDLSVGNEVLISGVTVTYYPDEATGALQVSNYQTRDPYSQVVSRDNVFTPDVLLVDEIDIYDVGRLVEVNDLTIVSILNGSDGAFTLNVEDEAGHSITVRVDADAPTDIVSSLFNVGDVIDIVGPISRYEGQYQIMLTQLEDVEIK